jgi:hypothetical protein
VTAVWIERAWSIAGLPPQTDFGAAVGALILAQSMRDGVSVDLEQAREAVLAVAEHCAHGVPRRDSFVQIGFTVTDVTGMASAVARGQI